MKDRSSFRSTSAALAISAGLLAGSLSLFTTPALADKPEWAGKEKGRSGHGKADDRQEESRRDRRGNVEFRFDDDKRRVAHDWYREQYGSGRCPPGLSKKNNGCLPPGQARKWSVGRPLPADVVFYEVPRSLVVKIGLPPAGQRYVRIASDLLLIAIATGMVIDAIEDLGR
jgi:hypothetical protein